MELPTINMDELHATGFLRDASQGKQFRVKSRITIHVSDVAQQHAISPSNNTVMSYDLVAIIPANDKVMHAAAQNEAIDIIYLDCSQKLPFFVKPTLMQLVLENGKAIEVGYNALFSDSAARRNFISNLQTLLHVSRGKGIILSSQAASLVDMRAPHDVINLGLLCGMSKEAAKTSISRLCEKVIDYSLTRRTHKAAIYVGTEASEAKVPASSLVALAVRPIESETQSWTTFRATREFVRQPKKSSSGENEDHGSGSDMTAASRQSTKRVQLDTSLVSSPKESKLSAASNDNNDDDDEDGFIPMTSASASRTNAREKVNDPKRSATAGKVGSAQAGGEGPKKLSLAMRLANRK